MKNPVDLARDIYAKLPPETVRYVIAGVLTTLLGLGVFTLLTAFGVNDKLANGISIAVAVLFAYIANKLYVFKWHTESPAALAFEFFRFVGGRILTVLLEFWGYMPLLRLLGERKVIAKFVTTLVVFILNYAISKLFVFRKKQPTDS